MPDQELKKHNILSNIVKLSMNEKDEALAALSLNPTIRWIKFVLTDDKPNYNKQRVPREEFANLIKTGIHMPIKMARSFIRDGHEFSMPIGAITGLTERDNLVEGIAALWSKEFPEEVSLLEEMNAEGKQPQLSWEILYRNSIQEDGEVEALGEVALSAATIVNMPAYEGRTPIYGMASKEEEQKQMEEKIKELEKALEDQRAEFNSLKEKYEESSKTVDTLTAQVAELEKNNSELSEYKNTVEAAKEREQKLSNIVELFEKAGVELPKDYLEDEAKAEKLLSMTLEQLDFMIQDIALFATKKKSEAGKKRLGSDLPNLDSEDEEEEVSPAEIAAKLKEELAKK